MDSSVNKLFYFILTLTAIEVFTGLCFNDMVL